jgi:ubiquinone/menaquinone biosynthesis C-methylase UbiE
MMPDAEIKHQVREFYDQVGWQTESDGFYQNASYEDLRPVSREYIHNCHMRVLRHLNPCGSYLLDAGSGPIQYPEYLEYSKGYHYRVCADISMVALKEARKRIGHHGLYVVCDVANLPFKAEAFDGLISLHTLHHLPMDQHVHAYQELYRTLAPNCSGVVVNGWYKPPLTRFFNFWMDVYQWLYGLFKPPNKQTALDTVSPAAEQGNARGTYVRKENAAWLEKEVGELMPVSIWCWRSVSVRFLRTFIHERLAGRSVLKLIYGLEERAPHFLGKVGQYPLVELSKTK